MQLLSQVRLTVFRWVCPADQKRASLVAKCAETGNRLYNRTIGDENHQRIVYPSYYSGSLRSQVYSAANSAAGRSDRRLRRSCELHSKAGSVCGIHSEHYTADLDPVLVLLHSGAGPRTLPSTNSDTRVQEHCDIIAGCI